MVEPLRSGYPVPPPHLDLSGSYFFRYFQASNRSLYIHLPLVYSLNNWLICPRNALKIFVQFLVFWISYKHCYIFTKFTVQTIPHLQLAPLGFKYASVAPFEAFSRSPGLFSFMKILFFCLVVQGVLPPPPLSGLTTKKHFLFCVFSLNNATE